MSTRDDILSFLRDPRSFAETSIDDAEWLSGLEDFALPSIAAKEPYPLRPAQESAWRDLTSNRVGLIQGPPGTGKTHLLSWLIAGHSASRIAAGMTARSFVTAFTRNAVCNVLEAVAKRQLTHDPSAPAPIFYGNPPPQGLPDGVEQVPRGQEGDLVSEIANGRVVVGGTVWSLYRLIREHVPDSADGFTAPLFDLICIDEASQMVLGHGLMALAGMDEGCRVIVAGDDQQLPPIRAMRAVSIGDREVGGSLYAFLKDAEVAELPLQETFRLNAPLAQFPEQKFYPNRYVSAVPDAMLLLKPNWQEGLNDFQRIALDPAVPVVVLVHDGPSSATSNPFEAQLAASLAEALSKRMLGSDDEPLTRPQLWDSGAAIISPHRAHNSLIRSMLPEVLRDGAFVETVDRIQGKERDAIILSYCVADPEFAMAEAEFIFAPERLNVAITRGRTKLVVLISRRLLDTAPAEQETMDKAELLREFVFSCEHLADVRLEGPQGRQIAAEIRTRGFATEDYVPEIGLRDEPEAPQLEMTPALEGVLSAIRDVVMIGQHQSAALYAVRNAMAIDREPISEARALHNLGWISLTKRVGARGEFWLARPFEAPRRVYNTDIETVRSRAAMLIQEERSGRYCFYDRFRDRFAWISENGEDVLFPIVQQLQNDGLVKLTAVNGSMTISIVETSFNETTEEETEPLPELSDADFAVLNELEDIEAKRINFGVFNTWVSTVDLARRTGRNLNALQLTLARLDQQGFIMLAEEGRVRSRMAELARELQHIKQRFRTDDAHRRPYLARSVKVELRDRNKPERSHALSQVMETARATAPPEQQEAITGVERSLSALWGQDAALAAFQAQGLLSGLAAWRGDGPSSLAISADTGSGKTEAAVLPLLIGAFGDRLNGIYGTRAILAYPRIRLATNQAQRLAAYLAEAYNIPNLPQLTLGLQLGDVPDRFEGMHTRYAEQWQALGPSTFQFPLFSCPACGAQLHLHAGAGFDGADELKCTNGDWSFGGWIGSKEQLITRPPGIFLPTVDSLHQWLHDPRYGVLFGDDARFAAPRALLADEIHLYTHIHGAQVGLALRRLAARAKINAPDDRDMLAIGMSATISDPGSAWGRLIGRNDVEVITPKTSEQSANPRGRETFFFIQPEVESRGANIAGASTTVQSLMCIAHGMRRRTGDQGGYRSLVFFDSIDKMRRLHGDFSDAEMHKELALFRISNFGDNSDGSLQNGCCGEPLGCDRFTDGECWWFAANDPHQRCANGRQVARTSLRVADRPIYSGTSSNAEALVKGSDIVFATSSLEVGYDDPDITCVYQHYAPLNLASFIQRKGRGGRGLDDRPTTAVTLSIYSPRDRWWFRRPSEMISPKDFRIPLNPNNYFVRRGQALCAILDGLAREEVRELGEVLTPDDVARNALEDAGVLVETLMGSEVWSEFGCKDIHEFWRYASSNRKNDSTPYLTDLRRSLAWAPDLLFDTINLPPLAVVGEEVVGGASEDIGLALATVAPGNATRRYNPTIVHWIAPVDGCAPWLDHEDYQHAVAERVPGNAETLLRQLPIEVRPKLEDVHQEICRPTRITVKKLGWMAGAYWNPAVGFSATDSSAFGDYTDERTPVQDDSRATLQGFLLVTPSPASGKVIGQLGASGAISAKAFTSDHETGSTSGLNIARVFWGAESDIRFDDRNAEPIRMKQTFVSPKTGRPLLHGYQVETEGFQFVVDKKMLGSVIDEIQGNLDDDRRLKNWYMSQFLRYRMISGGSTRTLPAYEVAVVTELLGATVGVPEFDKGLKRLRRFWSVAQFAELLADVHRTLLAQHPVITERRISKSIDLLDADSIRELIDECLSQIQQSKALRAFIESAILHSLALRLKVLVAHAGHGDERRLAAHVALPIQFGDDKSTVISICEVGADGDGTTRSFADSWEQVQDLVASGFLNVCPNDEEDTFIRRFWSEKAHHETWRDYSPSDLDALAEIAHQITDGASNELPAVVQRLLFGVEAVGAEIFSIYDIAADVEGARDRAAKRIERQLSEWELVSIAVNDAQSGDAPTLSRLLAAYASFDEPDEGALHPIKRLSEQIHRLSVPLCQDGCRSCVRQTSELMSEDLMEASISRSLLAHFFSSLE